jgi:hypothetical protein
MSSANTIFGPFDTELAKKLVKEYNKAVEEGEETFKFTLKDGQKAVILTDLAKYLIEHLQNSKVLK